jgi:hypothetical protein
MPQEHAFEALLSALNPHLPCTNFYFFVFFNPSLHLFAQFFNTLGIITIRILSMRRSVISQRADWASLSWRLVQIPPEALNERPETPEKCQNC